MRLKTAAVVATLAAIAVLTVTVANLLLEHAGGFDPSRRKGAEPTAATDTSSPAAGFAGSDTTASNVRLGPLPEAYKRGDRPAPDLSLIDQHGAAIRLSELRGRVVLLSFAFAHCHGVCPTLVKTLIDASRELGPELPVLIVTLDPANDQPSTLAEIATTWNLGPAMHYLSGQPKLVESVLDAYAVPRGKDEATGELTHPALVYVIDADGRLAYTFNAPSVTWLRDAVRRAQAGA